MAIEKIVKDGDTFIHTFVDEDTDAEEIDLPVETTDEDGNISVENVHEPKYTQKIIPDAKGKYKGELEATPALVVDDNADGEEKRG